MKELISCSICNHPQCVDLFDLQSKLAVNTCTSVGNVRLRNVSYICANCAKTESYYENYSQGKIEHIVLDAHCKVTSHFKP